MYVKVFASLWEGTLYGKTDAQLVFIFLLARCDSEGFVRCVPGAIAGPTGLSIERVNIALNILESPDPESNSKEMFGCRLERIGAIGTWQVVNYLKYRNMKDRESVKIQTRERVRRHRERNAEKRTVTRGNAKKRQGEGEGEGEEEESTHLVAGDDDTVSVDEWFGTVFWPSYPKKANRPRAERAMRAAFRGKRGEAEDELAEAVMAGLKHHKAVWDTKDRQYTPHPATWINGRCWNDEP